MGPTPGRGRSPAGGGTTGRPPGCPMEGFAGRPARAPGGPRRRPRRRGRAVIPEPVTVRGPGQKSDRKLASAALALALALASFQCRGKSRGQLIKLYILACRFATE